MVKFYAVKFDHVEFLNIHLRLTGLQGSNLRHRATELKLECTVHPTRYSAVTNVIFANGLITGITHCGVPRVIRPWFYSTQNIDGYRYAFQLTFIKLVSAPLQVNDVRIYTYMETICVCVLANHLLALNVCNEIFST